MCIRDSTSNVRNTDLPFHAMPNRIKSESVHCRISKQNFGVPVPEVWMRRVDGGVLVPAHLKTTSQVASRRSAKSGGKQREES